MIMRSCKILSWKMRTGGDGDADDDHDLPDGDDNGG